MTNLVAKGFLTSHKVPQASPRTLYQDSETRRIGHDGVPGAFAYKLLVKRYRPFYFLPALSVLCRSHVQIYISPEHSSTRYLL